VQSVNNDLFDNGFGGLPVNPAYDGGIYEAYPPLNPGGGGGGGGYTPPVPVNPTFVPPSAVQNDLTRALKIKLINADGIAGEFFEDEISKGITTSTEIVYSPSITFGNKRTYKVVSEGYVSKNYYELEIVKKYQDPIIVAEPITSSIDYSWTYDININAASTMFNGMGGYSNLSYNYNPNYYNFNYDYNRVPTSTPITSNESSFTEQLVVKKYLWNGDVYVQELVEPQPSVDGVVSLTFEFQTSGGINPIDVRNPIDLLIPSVQYGISFGSNFPIEASSYYLEYQIVSNTNDIIDTGEINISDNATNRINSDKLTDGKVIFHVKNRNITDSSLIQRTPLIDGLSTPTVYWSPEHLIKDFKNINYSILNERPTSFEIPARELKNDIVVFLTFEKEVKFSSPTIELSQNQYDVRIKESDTEVEFTISFATQNATEVLVYLSPEKTLRVPAFQKFVQLFFKKDFAEEYGSKKLIFVPISQNYGTGNRVEVIVNFIAVNDYPSIVDVEFADMIDVPAFSDFNIEYGVIYNTFSATSVDVYLKLKDGSRTGLFQNQPKTGDLKINLKTLRENYPQWAGSDNITLILIPYNRNGAEELIGNEYEVSTKLVLPTIELDENIIGTALFDSFYEKLKIIEPDKDSKYLSHLANFGNNEQILISSWENDDWSLSKKGEDELGNVIVTDKVESVILKLYSPLPAVVTENSTFWITKLMSNPLIETVILNDQANLQCPPLKGPNFDIDVDFVGGKSTNYESLDDLILSGSTSSTELISTYLSSSLMNTDELNIEYVSGSEYIWNNFVHFSSADERVNNFVYKVQLIEKYEELINNAIGDSIAEDNEIERQRIKKEQIIQGFDGFEKFLYTSSSLSWPYNGNVRRLSTSYEVRVWYGNITESAQDFDNMNQNYIKNNIPQYIVNNDENESLLLFFSMVGQHFDNIYYHTKSIENTRKLGYKSQNGISDKLLFDTLKSFNWDAKNLAANETLWNYTFGLDSDGNTKNLTPAKQRTNEVWRRIINNLPYLLKHKGTRRGIYALLSCYGIPSSNLSILEFGGPEVTEVTKSKLVMDNVTTALKMNAGSSMSIDWKNTDKNRKPNTIELFVKPAYSNQYTLISGSGWNVQLSGSTNSEYGVVSFTYGTGNTINSNRLPIFNDKFFALAVSSGSTGVRLDLRQADKERTIFESSTTATNATNWNTGNQIKIGGNYSGSIDELRLWSEQLDVARFYEHASFPEMINGNHVSSSTDDLYFRLDFEYPKNLALTSSLINVDTNIYFSSSLYRNNLESGSILTGSITTINLINGGSGYTSSMGTSNGSIPLYFEGGSFKHINPVATGTLTNGVVTSISISEYGRGMEVLPTNLQPSASVSQSVNNWITPITASITGSIANILSENYYALLSASAGGFDSITSYPYNFEAIDRSVVLEIPDLGSSRYSTNKVRFESQELVSSLSSKTRATKKSFDQAPIDSNRVGLFFSPTKELNFDIAKSMGGINLDNYIGDPSDSYKSNYSNLDNLRNYYFKRFDGRDIYAYINLIKLYEKSMFEDIKKMLPARVKATTGLLIEPHFLERSKIARKKPTGDDYQQDAIIDYKNQYNVISDINQYETIIDGNLSENLTAENNQYEGIIYSASLDKIFAENNQYDSLISSNDNLLQTAESYQKEVEIFSILDRGTILSEIDVYDLNTIVGQSEYETIGFGIYAQNGYAIRNYYDENNRLIKERIKVDLITEQKTRDVVAPIIKINGKGDPRGGYYVTSSVYTETRLNIQPFSGSKVINPGTGSIIAVQKVDGYLPTHYRNTSDLTRGLQNSFYKGSKNTAATTLDGTSPIETFTSNPNTLTVNKTGRNTSEPILEVE